MPGIRSCLVVLMVVSYTASAMCKDVAVIANKTTHVPTMSLHDLVKVCEGQVKRWPDGKPVTFVMRDPSAAAMRLILDKVYGMSKDEVLNFIAGANHGRTDHPAIMVVESEEAVVNTVESTPGAIGLVDVYSIRDGVNVLRLTGRLPLEPGYPLHGN